MRTMTVIHFYHLTTTPLERALPKLVEKAHAGKFRTLLVTGTEDRAEILNQLLWTYDPGSFLPHGTAKDGDGKVQPVFISPTASNENGANILFITDGSKLPEN